MRFTRANKYNAKPVTIDGYRFDSTAEGARYSELRLLEKAGQIRELAVHPRYLLTVDDVQICVYEADFTYLAKDGERVVEDVKGVRTDVFRIKSKLMLACHGIEVKETRARTVRR
jgi:hypothetical protein